MGEWFGCALPDDFGDWQREYWFAHKSVAVIDKNYRCYLSFTGPDRVRYLNAILTNNIKDLPPAHGNISLLLNPQGRILAELETYALPESLFCVSYAMIRERLIETLDKYIIMDDVTLSDETQRFGTLALEGPSARSNHQRAHRRVDLNSLAELERRDARVRDESLHHHPPLARKVCRSRISGGARGFGSAVANASRKSQGGSRRPNRLHRRLARFASSKGFRGSATTSTRNKFLTKRRWKTAISVTPKGCYTGQEIVERVRSRGQVNRRRVGLRFSGDAVPEAGEILTSGGKEAGYVTRAAFSPALASRDRHGLRPEGITN